MIERAKQTRTASVLNTDAQCNAQAARFRRQSVVVGALAVVLWLVFWYSDTSSSMASIWARSETFGHGFLILPISAALIWLRRRSVSQLEPRPSAWAPLFMLPLGFGWLLARIAGVLIFEQYALVLMVIVAAWALLGAQIVRALTFPLGFLLFAVPAGEFLIPPLMAFTADFTVAALRLTGIPVYREGMFDFSIPSGHWSVVEGCSGLRYLIASITLGTLYAYLTYRSPVRRLLFVLLSILVPIIANGLRAFMIVLIAHLSDMRLALGVDHYIYGSVFFGIVLLLLFWLGSFWRERYDEPHAPPPPQPETAAVVPRTLTRLLGAVLAVVGISSVWPVFAAYLDNKSLPGPTPALRSPPETASWRATDDSFADWWPAYRGTDAQLMRAYRRGDSAVILYVAYYRAQRQNAELVNSQNVIVRQKHPVWSKVSENMREVNLDTKPILVRQTLLRSPARQLLVWDWFWLKGLNTNNSYLAKVLLAKDKLLAQRDDGAAVVIAAPYADSPETAARVLQAFARDMFPAIESSLAKISGRTS